MHINRQLPNITREWLVEALLIVFCLFYRFHLRNDMTPDTAMYTHCAKMILESKLLYVDFLELNPPWIMYLYLPHALLAKMTGISFESTYVWFVAALFLLSWIEIRLILAKAAKDRSEAVLISLTYVAANVYFLGRDENWGQKEHLFLLLYLPYFFSRFFWSELEEKRGRFQFLLGMQGAAGALIKPHLLLCAGFFEALLYLVQRDVGRFRSRAFFGFLFTVSFYAIHWIFVPPGMRTAFFDYLVPLVREKYSVAYSIHIMQLVRFVGKPGRALIFLSACGTGLLLWRKSRPSKLVLFLFTFALLGLAIFIQQGKGWSIHQAPFLFGLTMGAGALLAQLEREYPGVRPGLFPTILGGMLAAYALALFPWVVIWREPPAGPYNEYRSAIEKHTKPRDGVLIFDVGTHVYYPFLLNSGRELGSRYLWFFPLAFFSYGTDKRDPLETEFITHVKEDIRRRRPRLVLVPQKVGCYGCAQNFKINDYVKNHGVLDLLFREGYQRILETPAVDTYLSEK